MQDLKGAIYFGGQYQKLEEVAHINWDILVIDEAHEGVDTYKTDVAFDHISRKYTLHLSGTPFKALWLLNRVDSAKALAKKLQVHPVFENYEIILAAGDGKLTEDEEAAKAYDKVTAAIKKYNKTITLSVGQLTAGVTIPEWTAVLMLSYTMKEILENEEKTEQLRQQYEEILGQYEERILFYRIKIEEMMGESQE